LEEIEYVSVDGNHPKARIIGVVEHIHKMDKHLSMFHDLNYLSGNIVIVGANGSGKTSYIDYLKKFSTDALVIIPSQKILELEEDIYFSSSADTNSEILKKLEDPRKEIKESNDLSVHHCVAEY